MPGYSARPPAIATILTNDAVVRITRWDFEPGAATGHHVHGLGYVVVPMTDCEFLLEEPDGDGQCDERGHEHAREEDRGKLEAQGAQHRCSL